MYGWRGRIGLLVPWFVATVNKLRSRLRCAIRLVGGPDLRVGCRLYACDPNAGTIYENRCQSNHILAVK